MEGLGEELGLGRGASALEGDRGKAGDEHDADRGVDRARLLGQLDPVHLGHDDVGQKQVEMGRLEQRHGLGAAADGLDFITDALQRPLQILAHRRIVFGQENSCHRSLYALLACVFPEANERFARCTLPQPVLIWHEI